MIARTRKRLGMTAAAAGIVAISISIWPNDAKAWWHGGVGVVLPPVVVAPPPVYAAPVYPPTVYAPPVYAPPPVNYAAPPPVAYAAPRRVWVPPHWEGPYWVGGHWG